jgi:hypothetical protein
MWVVKYDLTELKQEYLASKFTSVQSFLRSKWIAEKINTIKTKWWTKEKQELKARATDRALKKIETKLAEKLEPSSEFLLWNINKAIELTAMKLDQMEEKWNINVKDLNTIRSMNRIQNWQPTTYVKEEQDVNQNVRLEWIHIIIWPNNISPWENDVDEKV